MAKDWARGASFASAAEAKNRKRNSSYEQSSSSLDGGGAGKDSKGDFMSRPSPGEALLFIILMLLDLQITRKRSSFFSMLRDYCN